MPNVPEPSELIQSFIDNGYLTKEEYEKEFIEEWNKIFPNGFNNAINKLCNILEKSGNLEKFQSVIQKSLKVLIDEKNM